MNLFCLQYLQFLKDNFMSIVQINATYGYGSTGIIVRDLQNLCRLNNINCEVVCSTSVCKNDNVYKVGNPISNKIHAFLSRFSGKQGYFSFFPTIRLLLHLKHKKIEAIHLHNLHSGYINLPLLFKFVVKNNIPVIVTLHDCWFYTGGCCHYTSVNCYKWREACGGCPKRMDEVNAIIVDRTKDVLFDRYKLFGAVKSLYVIGVSKWILDEGKKTVFKNAKCFTIYNGIDINFFRPVKSDLRKKLNLDGKFVIIAPSNKWFLDVNRETFDFFASKLTEDMCMLFIGSGCNVKLLTNRMINYGFIYSREEIRDVYSLADVLLNCTREESLSLLNVEVQACGTPVVTYSNTGVKETVDGFCGFAVENGNPEAMWNAMMTIKAKGKYCFSEYCREWAVRKFDKNKNYQKYLDIYRKILLK